MLEDNRKLDKQLAEATRSEKVALIMFMFETGLSIPGRPTDELRRSVAAAWGEGNSLLEDNHALKMIAASSCALANNSSPLTCAVGNHFWQVATLRLKVGLVGLLRYYSSREQHSSTLASCW